MDATNTRQELLEAIERQDRIDAIAHAIDNAAQRVVTPRRRALLEGRWLGHALHPLLTDLPLGCWLSSAVLDVVGGRTGARSARRLVIVGVAAAVPTIASGLAEWRRIPADGPRRTAAVHAVAGAAATTCYTVSWWKRGRHPWRGRAWSLLGGLAALGGGYLGGHLSLARGVGGGRREPIGTPAARVPQIDPLHAGGATSAA